MKQSILKLVIAIAMIAWIGKPVIAAIDCPNAVKIAIDKYKAKDYIGCIQDLEDYIQTDPTNAIAYYYTAIAYMKVGMKDKAIETFEKVTTINSVPILSSYAIQASKCMMEGTTPCKYKKYKPSEIEDMVKDPSGFFIRQEQKLAEQKAAKESGEEEITEDDLSDIDKLIKGQYPDNIHPEANKVIQETKLIQEQEKVNSELRQKTTKPELPAKSSTDGVINEKVAISEVSDKEIADAVRTLNKAGYKFISPQEIESREKGGVSKQNLYKEMTDYYGLNRDAEEMAMMFGSSSKRRGDEFNQIIPLLLMQEQQSQGGDDSQKKINPELIKTMMMSTMMGDFDIGFDKDK